MAEFTFNLNQIKGAIADSGSASTFTIKGPPGLTQEQAFEIFKKQATSGSLTGFKPGESLSAATQAASGLASAQAALAQAQASVSSAIGTGLNSVSKAFAAAGGAQNGSLAATAKGLTATVGPAVSSISGALTTGINAASSLAQQGSALVKSAINQGSTAISSIQTINKNITNRPVTSPITTADFTKVTAGIKSGPAVSPIGPMSVPEVNGVLAQAKNLVGQASTALSNTKGLGEFGLNISQLEAAGYVKPGTKALVSAGQNLFSRVAKSPAIWTGKDGIKSANDLLKNAPKQSLIQQDLMTKGVAALGAVGIPVKNLSSQGIAGMSLNAAKDLPSAEAFVKGLPIPGDSTGAIKAGFSNAVRDGAFAVNLVNSKVAAVFKQQETPTPAADTVSRGTLDAASSRVIGNDKVPPPNYGPKTTVENQADVSAYITKAAEYNSTYLSPAVIAFASVKSKVEALMNQQSVTQQQYDAVNNEFQTARLAYNTKGPAAASEIFSLYGRLTSGQQKTIDASDNSPTKLTTIINNTLAQSSQIKELLNQVALKIEGRGEGE